jgi:hypothetical protein
MIVMFYGAGFALDRGWAPALQLGFVRMTGSTLDALDYVPRSVLEHVGNQLGISAPELATLRALYRRPMTLFLHQRRACEYAGLHRHDASDVTRLIDTLLSDSSVTLDRHRLAQQAREALYARRCLIPGDRDIEDWVRRAIYLIELQDRRYLDEVVPAKVRDNWLSQLMREKHPEPMTVLEWLRRPPRNRSRKTLDEEISKWLVIRAMPPPAGLDWISAQRLRAYMPGGCAGVGPSRFARLPSHAARLSSRHCCRWLRHGRVTRSCG